jgi:hypothetical protein
MIIEATIVIAVFALGFVIGVITTLFVAYCIGKYAEEGP